MEETKEGAIERLQYTIEEADLSFKRLDVLLDKRYPDLSRTKIKKIFEEGLIQSPNSELKLNKLPPVGAEIQIELPPPPVLDFKPEKIDLDIQYEDEDLIILNKQAGLVVHPAPGNWKSTLVNGLMYHLSHLQASAENPRPGIVHRLDKGTTGLMVVAKNEKTHQLMIEKFQAREVKKKYLALTIGKMKSLSGSLERPIGRHKVNRKKMSTKGKYIKEAKTEYLVLEEGHPINLVKLNLLTGRTHQIRVHLSELLNTPILNDELYGNRNQHLKRVPDQVESLLHTYPHPMLHSCYLAFQHPRTNRDLTFHCSPPTPFFDILKEVWGISDYDSIRKKI